MKKAVYCILWLISGFSVCFGQTKGGQFILKGKVTGRDTGNIILSYNVENGNLVKDTAMLKAGTFTFTGNIAQPTVAALQGHVNSSSPYDSKVFVFFMEASKMTTEINESNYQLSKLTGSVSERENEVLQDSLAPLLAKLLPLDKEYSETRNAYHTKKDTTEAIKERIKALKHNIDPLLYQRKKIYYNFVTAHPDSYVSANVLDNFTDPAKLGGDSAMMYFNGLSTRIQNSIAGKNVYNSITSNSKAKQAVAEGGSAAIGNMAPLISEKDVSGKTINLNDFKGKAYVLLDFWASWCPPCRAAVPQVKQVYRQYHSSGLEIIGISLDFTRDKWIAAIKADSLNNWPQIYAGFINTPGNFAKEQYGVTAIPRFVLIDKTGKIIGRYQGVDDNAGSPSLKADLQKLFPPK